jgi:hypothetical protein
MRLLKKNIERDGTGFMTLQPEEPEDMVFSPPPLPFLSLSPD